MSDLGLPVSDPGLAVFCEGLRSSCLWPRSFCPQNPSSSMPQTTTPVVIQHLPPQVSDSPVLRGRHTQPPTLSYGPCPSLWCRSTPSVICEEHRCEAWTTGGRRHGAGASQKCGVRVEQRQQVWMDHRHVRWDRVHFFWCYDGIDAQNLLFTSQTLTNWWLGRWMGARFEIVWGRGEWNCVREWSMATWYCQNVSILGGFFLLALQVNGNFRYLTC